MEIQLWKHISCSPSLVGQWPQNPGVTPKEQWTYPLNSGCIIEQQSCPRTQESHHRTEQSSRVAPEPSSHSTLLKRCISKAREKMYMRNSGRKVDHISRHTTPRHSTLLLTRQKSPPRPTQVPHPNFFSETITKSMQCYPSHYFVILRIRRLSHICGSFYGGNELNTSVYK